MADMLEYKCPCCGGAIEFNSQLQKMKCPYCDTEFDVETLKSYDANLKNDKPDNMDWNTDEQSNWQEGETDNMSVYVCKSCGGEIIGDENMGATSCPYCGNPVVIMGKFSGDLRPDYVIPFKLDKNSAKAGLKNYLKGKWLLPKIFKDENHIDEIKGIYVPFWLFGADADARISYKATKVRFWSDSDYDYTDTSYFSLYRAGSIGFDKIPVDGSSKMPDDLMESIEPFNSSEAVDFQTAYLAGYLADKYDVNVSQSVARANQRIRTSTEQMFAATAEGYSSVTPESTNISLFNAKSNYALYPVWLLNTSWNGKNFLFAMNGQTGKFVGDLPVDMNAFWKWFAIFTAIFGAVAYGLAWIIHLL